MSAVDFVFIISRFMSKITRWWLQTQIDNIAVTICDNGDNVAAIVNLRLNFELSFLSQSY